MAVKTKADFSGYVTKFGIKCSDGRTITAEAFKHQDGMQVPMVWQHQHDDPGNVLGHFELEHRDDGVYGYGFFNESEKAETARELVKHDDVKSLSIYANSLLEKASSVMHGVIREVSLVLAGANPGAFIDNIALQHGDETVVLEDEAIIYTGLELEHEDKTDKSSDAPAGDDKTVQDVYDSMSAEQKEVVHYMVGAAIEQAKTDESGSAAQSATTPPNTDNDDDKEIRHMSRNAFEAEREKSTEKEPERHVLSHDAIKGIVQDATRRGSLKEAVEHYALQHGINDIDTLFPDAKNIDNTPQLDTRRMEWVRSVLGGTRHSPFTRIKNIVTTGLTYDSARARGYVKGTLKKEEFFGLTSRVTTPATVYKKQKLDRDDIIDITDFDVVVWLKAEMRLMLEEELARAILVGDGRAVDDEDKIKDPAAATEGAGIRAVANDHELYAATVYAPADFSDDAGKIAFVEQIMQDMRFYKGSGSPTFYTTLGVVNALVLAKDGMGRRLWRTKSDLATEMGVANIVEVEVMEDEVYADLVGVIVNLSDYTVGTDRGGDVSMFDDFDIDYNQYKYLIETRLSGALTKIRSALVVRRAPAGATLVAPVEPDFDGTTITIPTETGVTYTRTDTGATVAQGSTVALADGETLEIQANPTTGNYFETDQQDSWTFTNPA
jgi:HK97 family phage prohead protease